MQRQTGAAPFFDALGEGQREPFSPGDVSGTWQLSPQLAASFLLALLENVGGSAVNTRLTDGFFIDIPMFHRSSGPQATQSESYGCFLLL